MPIVDRSPVIDAEELTRILRAAAPFDEFSNEQLLRLAACLEPRHFEAGQTIVREGEPADCWYAIADGSAEVGHTDLLGQAVTLAVLGPGDSFGERALIGPGQPRSATVRAMTAVDAFALPSDAVRTFDASHEFTERLNRRLDAMSIDAALKRASPFAGLPQDALRALAERLQPEVVRAGELVIREGAPGERLYLVRSGTLEVVRRKRRVALLGPGDTFGEAALLTSKPRTATVRALADSQLLALERDDFHAVAREQGSVAAHFRELIHARFRGAPGQPLLIPDPVTTIMPLVGPRRSRRYWAVLLSGTAAFIVLSTIVWLNPTPAAVYAVTVIGSLVGPVVFVQYLAESNILTERPLELVLTAALSAALALPAAIWLQNEAGLRPGGLPATLSIASIEETAKLIGVIWLLRLPALRFRMDGVIFGAAAGMGFAAIETGLFALARVETPDVLVSVLWFRALLSPFNHGTWTAILCATLWRARMSRAVDGVWRVLAALGVAVALHALWDWRWLPIPFNFAWLVLMGAASVLILRAILHRAAEEEARAVVALAPEVVSASRAAVGGVCTGCARRAPAGARYCPRCGLALRMAS